MQFSQLIRSAIFFLFVAAFGNQQSHAQCPSVTGTGDPAVILLNLYGIPNAAYFLDWEEEARFGMTAGVQLGAILSPEFQVVSGAEMNWIKRTSAGTGISSSVFSYDAFALEIPLDLRMRFHKGREQEAFFILGAGFVLANVRETNDPRETTDELLWHQLNARIGFEHTITVNNTFNILWGILGKAAPLDIINEDYSPLVGTYYAGLKVGIQLGL